MSDDILFSRDAGVATVTLNRPRALNALTLGMYRAFDPVLREWAADPGVRVIVIRGAGERAFCAGGDVRAVYEAGRGLSDHADLTSVFFREEYQLIGHIHRLRKPYVAIIDGITMGGGAGVSVNGAFRVATERTTLAMPETGIGLFPDVGATRFLNLCPGRIGRYLGLTGARLGPADALYCGFATHYVPRDRVPELITSLATVSSDGDDEVRRLLASLAADPGPSPLKAKRPAIDRCFGFDSVEAILQALAHQAAGRGPDSEWAAETRAGLLIKSPTSLKITLRQLIAGVGCSVEEALKLEYRLTQHVMEAHDFYEGVRAVLVDKDQKPHWQPATLDEVTDSIVDSYFAPLGERELQFQ